MRFSFIILALTLSAFVRAQHVPSPHHQGDILLQGHASSPYAGLQSRAIKALSPQ